jgi:plastocyanin domain-containing protein
MLPAIMRTPFILLVSALALVACNKKSEPAKSESAATVPAGDGKIAITVTDKGFEPDGIKVKKDTPYQLTFTRKTEKTCATEVVLQLGGGKTVEKKLPLNEPVTVDATFTDTGDLRYACGMDMIKGTVHVE